MILQLVSAILLSLSSFVFAQDIPTEFTIHRVEAQNRAVVASKQADAVRVGEEFTIETAEGDCHLPVTKVVEDYFYVDTQQCESDVVTVGTVLHSTRKIQVERAPAAVTPVIAGGETVATEGPEWMQSEFYQDWVKDRASSYISYYTGNTLSGSIAYSNTLAVEDLKGSNAIGVGLDYKIVELPYKLSVVGGFAYALPRAYGSYHESTPTASGRRDFDNNPELEIASLYANLRYEFADNVFGLLGINRLFARLKHMQGDMSGDFGFHVGARYYPTDRLARLFVDADINFYNMNYEYQNVKADFSLTELELRAGYTF
jgi:hypothetical protein